MMLHSAGKAKAMVRSILRRLGDTYGGREMEYAAAYLLTYLSLTRFTYLPTSLPYDLSTYLPT